MTTLKDQTALVTGAGSGLGAAIARALHEAGMKVVVADISRDKAEKIARAIDETGERVLPLAFDVADERAADDAVAQVLKRFGSLDVLVNNAGTDVTAPIEELSVADWDRVMATNLRGPFVLTKAALTALQEGARGTGGQVINIASTAARRCWPNASVYHASKFGLVGLSHALHAELRAKKVRVSTVVCGGMRTPFLLDRFPDIDASKLQDPARVAEAVRFVASVPPESVIAEIMVLPVQETSWP